MAARTKRPRTVKQLTKQLARVMPDPKGDRLRAKIARVGTAEPFALWQKVTPEFAGWCGRNINPPRIAEHVIKVTNWDQTRTVLVFYEPPGDEPTLFMLVPNPMESL